MSWVWRSLLITVAVAKGYAQSDAPDAALFRAIRSGDVPALRSQLGQGANKNARDRRGSTALMYAAAFGAADSVRALLDAGADVNARNSFEATALVWAAGDEAKVHLLVEHGADVNARTKLGRTPLMVAASCDGCSETVRYLISKGADAKAKGETGAGPLQFAALAGDSKSVSLLLAAGADAKAADRDGGTPLMAALQNCNADAAKALISRGANVNAALTSAGQVKFGPIQLVGVTPLAIAAPYCSANISRTLLRSGANVNSSDVRGLTPLMLAVASESQSAERVRELIEAGAAVNAKSKAGETALDWALRFGNPEVVSALRAAGAQPGLSFSIPRRPGAPRRSVPAAIEPAAALLGRSGTQFFTQSGCVGCHHQPMAMAALATYQRAGWKAADASVHGFQQMIESEWTGEQEQLLERIDPGGSPDGQGYAAWALNLAGYAPNSITDVVAANVAAQQKQAGNWHVGDISRSPIQESDFARTARSLRLLQVYGPPARKAEFDGRIARARDWLARSAPVTNDDAAMQMVGLHWAGAVATSQAKALTAQQRADGGWAQNSNLESDAFATGETLWALLECGALRPSDAAYLRGVEYLLNTQWPDGSWYVRSRAPKIQPYFQSGFPFEHDQWISSAATAWAVMALAPTMEKEKLAIR
jgi:ankyrin repeat protein